jgi:hypothetical protein
MLQTTKKALRLLRREGWGALMNVAADRLIRRPQHFFTMLTPEERAWTRRYIAEAYTGAGHLVDLGCWLGSSTIAMAEGLQANERPSARRRRVHAYDRFLWEEWMEPIVAGTRLAGSYRAGDLFLDEFARQVRRWQHRIDVHVGDLLVERWLGEPIEFLFIDAMKSWELAERIHQQFYPRLVPGQSLIVHQDFGHHYTYWIHLLVWRFRDCFEPICHVPNSPSVVFRCIALLPQALVADKWSLDSFGEGDFEAAFAHSLNLVSPDMHSEVRLARIRGIMERGDLERADWELCRERDHGTVRGSSGLHLVEEELAQRQRRSVRVAA